MSSMNARFKSLGFGSKRKSSANNISTSIPQNPTSTSSSPQLAQLPGQPAPTTQTASSSTASLPMNHQGGAGVRPPSYSNQYTPVGRTTSPMAQGTPRTPPTQMMGGPPPINTAATGGYPPQQGGMGGPPPPAGPPQYNHPPQYGAGGAPMQAAGPQYGARNNAVEVEGAGKSKAQLIVGIDFVSISWSLLEFA